MKILFSPAITLMNQLNYRRKFAMLGLISLIAISVLIYSLFIGLNQVVTNSQKQLLGLKLINPLSSTIQFLQQHRGLSAGYKDGSESMLNERIKKETKVTTSFMQLERLFPALLLTSNSWIKIKNSWNNIAVKGLNKPIAINFAKHTQLINQLQFFKVLLADDYALSNAPEIDAFYLIDTSINKIPEAMEQLGLIRDFGTRIFAKQHATEYQRNELLTLISRLETAIHLVVINLNKTAQFNPLFKPQLAEASRIITTSSQQIIDLVQSSILDDKFNTLPDDFFKQGTRAINKSYTQMYQVLFPTIKAIINTRLQDANDRLYLSTGISLTLMIMVLYFVLGIYYSILGNVQSLTKSLQLFADGDLQERIELETQDELKWVGNSFNQLAEKTTSLLENVENSQKKIQQVLDGLLTMAGILLPDGTLDFANSRPLDLAELKPEDVIGKKLWDCPWFAYSNTTQDQIRSDCKLAALGDAIDREIEFALKDKIIWVDFSIHPVFDDQGKIKFLVAEARDASRRRLAEEYSKRSQKMNALGKLVGGIAHDYNNMLGVILGYAELLELNCQESQTAENYISEILRAGERGRLLTKKMLAFSKSESSNPTICDINQALVDLKDMLAKSLTASINLKYNLAKDAWPLWIDVSEMEDAILNLSLNAKYAMGDFGTLTVSTENVYLDREQATLLGLTSNDYLKLSILDTGCGIDDETKIHIFDPFFSTKGDAGNGLGLSQVFGFMERSGGTITVESQIDKGSQFNLYFPRYQLEQQIKKTYNKTDSPQLAGNETILVVDDEPALRELAKHILNHFGYNVKTATSGTEALYILSTESIDLMLSDVIMPNMDGFQLARQVSIKHPQVKIQLTSGFSDNKYTGADQHLKDTILNKPYNSKQLLSCIRLLLDGDLQTHITSE